MRELKPLSRDAVDAALAKAERYRFLNEPGEAESICLDVLAVDATNQAALVTLLLALTDQFGACRRRAPAGTRDARGARERVRQGLLRRHHRRAARQGAARPRRRRLERRRPRLDRRSDAAISNGPNGCARPATTTRGCDGTPARGSSTVIRICARRPRIAAKSRCSSRRRGDRDQGSEELADPNLGLPLRSPIPAP